jgi:Protein of unknown function (DUF3450)
LRTHGGLYRLHACLVVGLALAFGPAPAQETLSSVQRELERVEREIEREKELHKQERKRASEFDGQKAQRLQAVQEQTRLTQVRIDSLKRAVDKARSQKTAHKAQAQFFIGKEKEFRKAFAASLRGVANDLRQDFPHNREKRVADLDDLAKGIEDGITPAEEGLNRLTTLLSASLDFASDVEVYSGVYTAKAGGHHEGTFVRLGAAFLAFISQDGQLGALLTSSPQGYVWLDTELAPDLRQAISVAVRVAQGKESPRLVGLPIALRSAAASAPAQKTPASTSPTKPVDSATGAAQGGKP